MVTYVDIPYFADENGELAVVQDICPFSIKRIFYIYNVPKNMVRGNHGHINNKMLLIPVKGSCSIYYNNGFEKGTLKLESPSKGLILEPQDWHRLSEFSEDCVLLVLCSEKYNQEDYFFKEPNDKV